MQWRQQSLAVSLGPAFHIPSVYVSYFYLKKKTKFNNIDTVISKQSECSAEQQK